MKKILFAAFALSSVIFSSCDTEDPKIDISYEKALMDKSWEVVGITQDPNINEPTNTWYSIWDGVDPCIKDNVLIFTSKSTAVLDELYRKCAPLDPEQIALNYVLQNENYIKLYPEGGNAEGPYWRSGDFKWLKEGITSFTIEEKTSHPSTPEVVVSTIYTYKKRVQ